MKEVLTGRFWREVKKIFDEARADPPPQKPKPAPKELVPPGGEERDPETPPPNPS